MKHVPYTYLIGWSKLNKWYYGSRYAKGCSPDDLWKTYFTSSRYVTEFRSVNGEPDIIEIRKTFDNPRSASNWEFRVLRKMKVRFDERWLNKCEAPGPVNNGYKRTLEHRLKISMAVRGRKQSKETRQKRSMSMKGSLNHRFGKTVTEETREKNRLSSTGKMHTDHTKNKIKKSLMGHQVSEDTRAKIGNANRGKKRTDTKKYSRPGSSNPRYDSRKFTFIHDNGSIFHGTKFEFRQRVPGSNPQCIISGRYKKTMGWSLCERNYESF